MVGTQNVLRACSEAGVKRLIFVSSVAAAMNPNWPKNRPMDENCWTDIDYCMTIQVLINCPKILKSQLLHMGLKTHLLSLNLPTPACRVAEHSKTPKRPEGCFYMFSTGCSWVVSWYRPSLPTSGEIHEKKFIPYEILFSTFIANLIVPTSYKCKITLVLLLFSRIPLIGIALQRRYQKVRPWSTQRKVISTS